MTTSTNTTTSLPSAVYSRRKNSNFDRVYITQPLVIEYQQNHLKHSDHKLLTPISKTNNTTLSSPISSSYRSSATSSSLSSSPISFTCPKGHEESSSSSPIGSSLNQHPKFTTQTSIIDSSREDIGHRTTTTRSMMTMSISPNRQHHQQTYSTNPINTSNRSMTNTNDGLKQQCDQIDSTLHTNSCLKSQKINSNRTKKSVRFDRHLPTEYRSPLPSTRTHYQLPVTLTSSCICNRTSDNEEQKKKPHSETLEEKEKNEMTRRTIIANPTPLTTHTVHRSFSLSPSPPSKKENNVSRTSRQEKRENVDELNCMTPSRQVTTAATTTHLYCTPHTTIITYKDGNYDTSSTKELNGTTNFPTSESLTHSIPEKQMPSTNSSMKTPMFHHQQQATTKKFIGTGGFFSFIHRSNSNQNKSSLSDDNNKQLKRTTSIQRRPKQYISNENKRLSADIEPLHTSSISLSNAWKEDINKVVINGQKERQSTKNINVNKNISSNIDSSIPSSSSHSNIHVNRSSISMLTKPTTTIIKSSEGDSLNNGLLFQPSESGKRDSLFLSPSSSFSHTNESTSSSSSSSSSSGVSSSTGKMMQTSTLIISTPPQYHYYLYPPQPQSSSTKKNPTNNRTISNVSMNSISTNSSSSSSYDSQMHDLDDEPFSYSAYQNKIYQSGSYSTTKPVILSDSVQAFWPPQSSVHLNNDPEQIKPASTREQNKHSNLIKHKQSELRTIQNNVLSSMYSDDSSSISNGNQTDILSPSSTSLILNNKEEVRSYTEQNLFHNPSLRIANDTSFEDTQASYCERLREKSRSITNNRSLTMNVNNSSLSRSRSKDTLNNQSEDCNSLNQNILRPKSAGQTRIQALLSPVTQEIANDFQSKRQFFENRIYSDNLTSSKVFTLPPTTNHQRPVTKQPSSSSESMIRTTKYFDSPSNQASLPPAVYRKPVRIVKAVQRSITTPPIDESKTSSSSSPPTKMNSTNDLSISSIPCSTNDHHLSSEYVRNLFPVPDHQKRNRSRQNSSTNTNNEHVPQTEDLLLNLTKRLKSYKENQQVINDEIEINTKLGTKLIHIIESEGEVNEIGKFKLHINEIDTITSVLLKLSTRLAKVENDLSMITDAEDQMKVKHFDL
ncbi:hypothetical protein I4U23_012800 [Adineta vaga]|nr:hypothetical protein I4U23_012800 [Adineta vaga]